MPNPTLRKRPSPAAYFTASLPASPKEVSVFLGGINEILRALSQQAIHHDIVLNFNDLTMFDSIVKNGDTG